MPEETYTLRVPLNDSKKDFAEAILKKPDRNDVGLYLYRKDKGDFIGAKEGLLQACWISGDESIMKNDELFFSSCTVLDSLITVRMATLKKN